MVGELMFFAGTVVTLHDFWGVASGFMDRLGLSLARLRARNSNVPPADRTFIQAMNNPVAGNRATQVTFQLIGDNNRIIQINGDVAAELTSFFRDIAPAGGSAGSSSGLSRADLAALEQARENLLSHIPGARHRRGEESPASFSRTCSGRLIWVRDKWYVEPTDQDVLLPPWGDCIESEVLQHHLVYLVQGAVVQESSGGTAFEIEEILGVADGRSAWPPDIRHCNRTAVYANPKSKGLKHILSQEGV